MPTFHASCHCGNLTAELDAELRPEELTVLVCDIAASGH